MSPKLNCGFLIRLGCGGKELLVGKIVVVGGVDENDETYDYFHIRI